MSQCNVDFFDKSLTLIHHDVIDTPMIDEDYLSPTTNSIEIGKIEKDKIKNGSLIYLKGSGVDFLGIVSAVDDGEYLTTINYLPIISLFDHDIMFDTNYQTSTGSSTSLEDTINLYIRRYHTRTGGTLGNDTDSFLFDDSIVDIGVSGTPTTNWGFNLKSDYESMHNCKIGFLSILLNHAMTKYGVGVTAFLQYTAGSKKLAFRTGKIEGTMTVDADLPSVKIKALNIQNASNVTNKLEIWNSENFTQKVYYYLHSDGSYDTSKNTDRIEPVKIDVTTAAAEYDQDGLITKTFAQAAKEAAVSTLGGITWTNYIELEVLPNDFLIKPLEIPIGQPVNVYHNGTMYSTILTGRKQGDVTTLVFGTIRLDLTKKLKLGGN